MGSLTKEELKEIVDRVYASWNQQVPASTAKVVYNAWWRILHDLTVVETNEAIDALVIEDSYMPRPGSIRRLVISSQGGLEAPPAPLEAWQQFRSMAEAANSGQYREMVVHPVLRGCVTALGGSAAFGMHTNGDRTMFLEAYERAVQGWERETYAVVNT